MIRRVNLFAGPGSGKSTLSAKLFAQLKIRHFEVELVSEFIKTWAYEGRHPKSFDQYFVHASQLHAEDLILNHCQLLVTDSPLIMNAAYASFYGCEYSDILVDISLRFEAIFPSLNLFIKRSVPYNQNGRYQNSTQAVEFDEFLEKFITARLGYDSFIHINVDQPIEELADKIAQAMQAS